jgi:hypothetical protein
MMSNELHPEKYDELFLISQPISEFSKFLRRYPKTPYLLGEELPKVMVRPSCIARLSDGLHDIEESDGRAVEWDVPADLLIAHVPLSTRTRLMRKIEDYRNHIYSHPDETEYTKTGDELWQAPSWQWRRWIKLKDEGRLDEEFQRTIFDEPTTARLRAQGVIRNATQLFAARLRAVGYRGVAGQRQ